MGDETLSIYANISQTGPPTTTTLTVLGPDGFAAGKKRGEKKDVYGRREDKQISLLSQEEKKERAKPISMSHPNKLEQFLE